MVRSLIIDQFIFIITSFSPNDDHHRVSLDSFYIMCVVLPFAWLLLQHKKEHTTYIRNLFIYFFFTGQEGELLKQVKKRIADFFLPLKHFYFYLLSFLFGCGAKCCSWNGQNCQNYELQLEIVKQRAKEWKFIWNIRPYMVW